MDKLEELETLYHLSYSKAVSIYRDGAFIPHLHNVYEIYFSISGADYFLINGVKHPVLPNDIFIIPPLVTHLLVSKTGEMYERYVLHVNAHLFSFLDSNPQIDTRLYTLFNKIGMEKRYKLTIPEPEAQHFKEVCHESFRDQVMCDACNKRLIELSGAVRILALLVRKLYADARLKDEMFEHSPLIARAVEYVESRLATPIQVEEMANALYVSKTTLYQEFKKNLNMSAKQYIVYRKILEAKQLLREGGTVKATAEQCGFNDYTNFIKAFTNEVGISPKNFKKLRLTSK